MIFSRSCAVCLNNKKHDRSWNEYDIDEESHTFLESSRQDARQCALIFQRPLKVNITSRHLPFVLANQNIAYCCGFFNKMLWNGRQCFLILAFFSRQISFLFNEDFHVRTLKINTTVISGSVFSSYSTPYFYWNQYFLSLFPCKHQMNIKCFRDVLCYYWQTYTLRIRSSALAIFPAFEGISQAHKPFFFPQVKL